MAKVKELRLTLQVPEGATEKDIAAMRDALNAFAATMNSRKVRPESEVEGQEDDSSNSAFAGVCQAIDCSTRGTWINPPADYIAGSSCKEAGWNWGVSSCDN